MSEYQNIKNQTIDLALNQTCPAVGYQKINVCAPVTVTPYAHAKPTTTRCCGNPYISKESGGCCGTKRGSCTFTISQIICIEVPVDFGASSSVGEPYVESLEVSSKPCAECKCTVREVK